MSSSEREGLVKRDRLAPDAIAPFRKPVTVISPSVTRRPALDSMLGLSAGIAERTLADMHQRTANGHQLDEDEIKDFRNIAELVYKQARLEMAVEQHVEVRAAAMENEGIALGVAEALSSVLQRFHLKADIIENITEAVLKELGLDGK